MYQVDEASLNRLLNQSTKILGAISQSGLKDEGLEKLLGFTSRDVLEFSRTIQKIKDDLKLWQPEG